MKHQTYFGSIALTSFNFFLDAPTLAEVVATYDASTSGLRSQDGRIVSRSAARHGVSIVLRLVRSNNRWIISKVEVVNPGTTS